MTWMKRIEEKSMIVSLSTDDAPCRALVSLYTTNIKRTSKV